MKELMLKNNNSNSSLLSKSGEIMPMEKQIFKVENFDSYGSKIIVPDFIKRLSENEVRNLMRNIASGQEDIFLEVRYEKKLVGFERVLEISKKRFYLYQYRELIKETKKKLKTASFFEKKYLRRELEFFTTAFETISKIKDFTAIMTGDEDYNTAYGDIMNEFVSLGKMEGYKASCQNVQGNKKVYKLQG